MKNIKLIGLLAASMTAFALALPARSADPAAATTCADGTTSTATGKGACSSHGGVQKASKTTAAPAATAPAATAPAAPTPAAAPATPASGAVKTCTDGTTSTASGKGACSGHGGVLKGSQSKSAAASTAPTTATPTVAAGSSDPAGATAKCKDGSYSKSQHRSGTCSSHGGVAEWLTAQ
jgi:Protein of unknown function (DUF3761)